MGLESYRQLRIETSGSGVTEVVLDVSERLNAVDAEGHRELAYVWNDLDADPATRWCCCERRDARSLLEATSS